MPSARLSLAALLSLLVAAGCAPRPGARSQSPVEEQPPPVFSLAASVADQPEDPAERGVPSRIARVTVYSDRALVSREATVNLTPEPTVFRFKKLPGWVDEGSVRAQTTAGKIVDVSVERRFLARSTDDGFRKAELQHKELLRKAQANAYLATHPEEACPANWSKGGKTLKTAKNEATLVGRVAEALK